MAVKIICNGYFRSGTTLLWSILKNNFKEYNVYYEPLHPSLAYYINSKVKQGEKDKLHGIALWDSYLNLSFEKKIKILKFHPNLSKDRFDWISLNNYITKFDESEIDSILQTNRVHFFLEELYKEYQCKIIHVVRDPYEVYSSMKKAYEESNSIGIKRILKKSLPKYMFDFFEISSEFDWVVKHYGKPSSYFSVLSNKRIKLNTFEMFCVVYCINNYVAIQSCKDYGLVLSYNKLLLEPESTLKNLFNFLEIDMKVKPEIKTRNKESFKEKKHFYKRFDRVITKYNLVDEYEFISNCI